MHMPVVSRNVVAIAMIVTGLVATGTAYVGDPGSSGEPRSRASNDRPTVIDPVAPVDREQREMSSSEEGSGSTESTQNPFVTSIGGNFEHTVKVRVSTNGGVRISVYYRDGKSTEQLASNTDYSTTRTFKGGYPLSMVVVEIPRKVPGRATRATCSITVDGHKVDSDTTTKPRSGARCVG